MFCFPLQHPLAGKEQPSPALLSLSPSALLKHQRALTSPWQCAVLPRECGMMRVYAGKGRGGEHRPGTKVSSLRNVRVPGSSYLGTCAEALHTFACKHRGDEPQRWVRTACAPADRVRQRAHMVPPARRCLSEARAHATISCTSMQLRASTEVSLPCPCKHPQSASPPHTGAHENQVQTDTHRRAQGAHRNACEDTHMHKRIRA